MTCKSLSDTTMESRADQRGLPSILSPALPHHTRSSSSIRHYSTVTAMSIGQPQKSLSRVHVCSFNIYWVPLYVCISLI